MSIQQSNDSGNGTTAPIEDKGLSTDEIFNYLNEDGEAEVPESKDKDAPKQVDKPDLEDELDEEDTDEDKKKVKKEEDEDELADLEAELEEEEDPSKEKLELVTPVSRREILKAFPELFKKFPYLEKAYYREQQFTKYFPNPDDARQAIDKAQTLDNFEVDIVEKGNVHNILKLIKDNNPNKFAEVCDNYMDHLADVDNGAYQHVLGNITKHIIASLYQEGKDSDNDEMKAAAVILNQYAFGSSKYKAPTKLARQASPENDRKQHEESVREREIIKNAFDKSSDEVSSKVNNFFRLNIEANIDPKKSMPDFVRKNATREAIEKIQDLISRDTRFKTLTDKLWENAIRANFSKESTDKIKKAFIARGRSLLTPVVKSVRNEAMRGLGRKVTKDDDEEIDTGNKSAKSDEKADKEPRLSSKKPKASDIPAGMSTLDYLNS